jgi:hypothetical protein
MSDCLSLPNSSIKCGFQVAGALFCCEDSGRRAQAGGRLGERSRFGLTHFWALDRDDQFPDIWFFLCFFCVFVCVFFSPSVISGGPVELLQGW